MDKSNTRFNFTENENGEERIVGCKTDDRFYLVFFNITSYEEAAKIMSDRGQTETFNELVDALDRGYSAGEDKNLHYKLAIYL